jgi:NAD(P)H-hydrate epimerase
LKARGFEVRLFLLGARASLQGDAQAMAEQWAGEIRPLEALDLAGSALAIDALFGAGLSRPLSGAAAAAVERLNGSGIPVLAVDMASGLDGTTGAASGPAVRAARTVTFFRRKPGHLLMPGRALSGETHVADIGIPARVLEEIRPRTWANAPALWHAGLPRPRLDAHKYDRGHAIVLSGPADATGAARLGARGALRIGAGLVTVAGSEEATAVNARHLTAIMVRPAATPRALVEFLSDPRRNAVLFGPGAGVGIETADIVHSLLTMEAAAVLDADALSSFAKVAQRGEGPANFGFTGSFGRMRERPEDLFGAIKRRRAPVVLTPHEGEFRRLFPDMGGSKLERARAGAAASGAVMLLKGADTVIADPDGRAAINDNAPATLATAGSGDVLAGFVLGLLAQRMAPFEAACAAVWLHGECARAFGPGLIAEDLPEVLPKVLAGLM